MCSTVWKHLLIAAAQKGPPHHEVHLREGVVFGQIWDVAVTAVGFVE